MSGRDWIFVADGYSMLVTDKYWFRDVAKRTSVHENSLPFRWSGALFADVFVRAARSSPAAAKTSLFSLHFFSSLLPHALH